MNDLEHMKRALELARRGAGLVSPNPMVGAVLVNDGRVVGEGYHRYDWLKHAEVCAIDRAGALASGATLYCTLEPCCHHGRTPPCTDALIAAGISRAVVAMKDPDPRVSGRGVELLRSAGMRVEVGLCEQEASGINEAYLKFIRRQVPFVTVLAIGPGAAGQSGWGPSDSVLRASSEADAIALGPCRSANAKVVSYSLSRQRHRPLIILGTRDELDGLTSAGLLPQEDSRASVIEVGASPFEEVLARLAGLRAHSVYALCVKGGGRDEPLRFADRVIDIEGQN